MKTHATTNQMETTATKPEHTPTPWIARKNDARLCIRGTEHLFSVVQERTSGEDSVFLTIAENVSEEDAALIVRAVSSHASLIEALEAAMLELEANKVAMVGPEWASQRTMTGGALAKCARALHNAKAQA